MRWNQGREIIERMLTQDRADVENGRRVGSPVDTEFHLGGLPGLWFGHTQSGESWSFNGERDVKPVGFVGLGHGDDGGGELGFGVHGGEQVDVFGRPIEKPVGLDCISAGQGEPVCAGPEQSYAGESFVKGIHCRLRPKALN